MTEAIDQLYETLPTTKSDEKCKRYSLVLTIVSSKGHKRAAELVADLGTKDLNQLYHDINVNDLATLYMDTIDEYTKTKLRPAFLELIECSKRLGTYSVQMYLKKKELMVITELYKQVTQSSDTKIDPEYIGLSNYRPKFQTILKNLFRENLLDEGGKPQPEVLQSHIEPIYARDSEQPHHERPYKLETFISPRRQKLFKLRQEKEVLSQEEWQSIRIERRRRLNRERQRRIRQQEPERIREIERLRYRQRRLKRPDEMRASERERQTRRRDKINKLRMQDEVMQLQAVAHQLVRLKGQEDGHSIGW